MRVGWRACSLATLLVGALASLACGAEVGAQDPALEAAHQAVQHLGRARPDDAVAALTAEVEADPDSVEARLAWAAALSSVGRYDEAGGGLTAFLEKHPDARGVRLALGRALAELGHYDEARRILEAEIEAHGPDRLAAQAVLGRIALDAGDRQGASARFDALIDAYNDGTARTADDLEAVATACRYLGAEDPQLFKDALKAFDEAIAADDHRSFLSKARQRAGARWRKRCCSRPRASII